VRKYHGCGGQEMRRKIIFVYLPEEKQLKSHGPRKAMMKSTSCRMVRGVD
jgi:hypothetical protein